MSRSITVEHYQQISLFEDVKSHINPITRFEYSLGSNNSEAWQYKMRQEYAEMESMNPYWEGYDISIEASEVREISYREAKAVIEKYEWLGCMPVCVRHCYGLFFPNKSKTNWLFGGGDGVCPGICREPRNVG